VGCACRRLPSAGPGTAYKQVASRARPRSERADYLRPCAWCCGWVL